jgi:TonB family protein
VKLVLSFVALLLLLDWVALSVSAAGTPPPPVREKWALIVGVGQFQDAAIKPLAYSSKSARELANVFEDERYGHFTPGHIRLLVNNVATRYGIEHSATENWLFRKALPNDLIFVYIATRMVKTGSPATYYLCAADSIASDIEATGISLEEFLKNLQERTQSKRIVCILDTVPEAGALQEIVSHTGVSILCTKELPDVAESALVQHLCEGIRSSQGNLTLHAIAQHVNQMCLAADNDLLAAIPLGVTIRSNSPLEGLQFGHPVGSLALDRPDLDQMINTHNTENDEGGGGSTFSQTDFSDYLNRIKKSIQMKWQPPPGFEDHSVATMFTIAKDGTIADASVVNSSGNDAVDSSALAALKAASPLEPLPPGSPASVQIKYKFSWHVKSGK